jgi:hypothetical protein
MPPTFLFVSISRLKFQMRCFDWVLLVLFRQRVEVHARYPVVTIFHSIVEDGSVLTAAKMKECRWLDPEIVSNCAHSYLPD